MRCRCPSDPRRRYPLSIFSPQHVERCQRMSYTHRHGSRSFERFERSKVVRSASSVPVFGRVSRGWPSRCCEADPKRGGRKWLRKRKQKSRLRSRPRSHRLRRSNVARFGTAAGGRALNSRWCLLATSSLPAPKFPRRASSAPFSLSPKKRSNSELGTSD